MSKQTRSPAAPSGRRTVVAPAAAPPSAGARDPGTGRNEVVLVGRVSAPPETRELPSGDVLLTWRLVVDRPPPRRAAPAGVRLPTVDTLTCTAWTSGARRVAGTLEAGDVVEVVGALRQRFWKAGAALASRTEVEADAVKRLARGS